MYNNKEYEITHLSTTATNGWFGTQVFSGRGKLHAININQTSAVIVGIYNGLSTSTTVAGKLKASIAEQTLLYDDAVFPTGLYIEAGTGGDYTVLWAKN